MRLYTTIFLFLFLFLNGGFGLVAQTAIESDTILDVFQQAKIYAFEEDNFDKAIDLISEALVERSKDADLELFLARMYFWGLQHDQAVSNLNKFLEVHPSNPDAYSLFIDIYESQKLYSSAIKKCESALLVYPEDLNFRFRLAYNQSQNEEFSEASKNCNHILEINPEHKKALILSQSIRQNVQRNFIVAEYRYYFLDTPEQALNFYNIQYGRKINGTTLIGMVNMAKSFDNKGFQYNFEMYNDLGKKYYSYVHLGYSNSILFPDLRINAAVYKSMPHRIEGSIFLTLMKMDKKYIRVLSPSITKNIGYSALSVTGNIINKDYSTEFTYRVRFRQYIANHTNYVGIAFGSFSRDENIGQSTEQDLVAKFVSYQAQINLGLAVLIGVNYDRSISKKVYARDQLSVYLKHNF